jgi:hypothetical protein
LVKGEAVKVRFDPGRIVVTPAAMNALAEAGHLPSEFLSRHDCGDWGKLDDHGIKANNSALKTGLRILASYELGNGDTVWVITEAVDLEAGQSTEHSQLTTLLLPSDY